MRAISYITYMVLGALLANMGGSLFDWRIWAALVLVAIIDITSHARALRMW